MTMGSIIEMYLTAYGWQLYDLFYSIFWMTKILLYPLVRLAFDILFETVRQPGSYHSPIRDVMLKVSSVILVFILGVIPLAKFDVRNAKLESSGCGTMNLPTEMSDRLKNNFTGDVYVPLLPYFVMSISSGVNAVVLKNLPCAADLSTAHNLSNFSLSEYGDVDDLKTEIRDFNQHCAARAVNITREWASSSDADRIEAFRVLGVDYMADGWWNGGKIPENIDYGGTKYLKDVFYTEEAYNNFRPFNNGAKKAWEDMKLGLPLRIISHRVSGTHSDCQLSEYQQNSGAGCVSCGNYWDQLERKIAKNYIAGAMQITVSEALNTGKPPVLVTGKRGMWGNNTVVLDPKRMDDNRFESYLNEVVGQYSSDDITNIASKSFNDSRPDSNYGRISTQGEAAALTGLFAVNTIASFGSNLGDIAATVSKFTIAKISIRVIYPMLLMMVYAMWIVYMLVSEFKGLALIKGLVMIFVLKFCTSIFAIADRMESEIMAMLHPEITGIAAMLSNSPADTLIIMISTTVFYFTVPSILMYIVVMAGGPSASGLTKDTASSNRDASTSSSGIVTTGTQNTANSIGKGVKTGIQKIKK